jgi:hypothetical protein
MATFLPNVTDIFPAPAQFAPDFSFLDTMMRRRQAMYEQGYSEVAGRYKAISRPVTNPVNLQTRDQFLKEAQANLTHLSAMDLSQQQNVSAASNVFSPFYKNTKVLGDMALTQHWDSQESIAESYRLKDGGKEFSEDNLNYVRMQRAEFAKDSPDKWNQYYSMRRSYTPFYDYQKEIMEKMKEFKPSSYEVDKINGLYKIREKDSSRKEADVRRYLDAVLSDKARQQMRIEASVRLSSRPEDVAQTYSDIAKKELSMNSFRLSELDKEIKGSKDKAQVEMLKKVKENLLDQNREINQNLENIQKGNFDYVKGNAERINFGIYYNQKMAALAKGLSYEDISRTISADEVGIALMKEDRADARQRMREDRADARQMRALNMFQSDFGIDELSIGKGAEAQRITLETLQTSIDGYNDQIQAVTMENKQHILTKARERNPSLKLEDINDAFIANFIKTGGPNGKPLPRTDLYFENISKISTLTALRNSPLHTLQKIEEEAMQGLSEADRKSIQRLNEGIAKLPSVTTDDGSVITAKRLAEGLRNGSIKVSRALGSGTDLTFTIDGKQYKAYNRITGRNDRMEQKNLPLISMYQQIQNMQSQGGKAYDSYSRNRERFVSENFQNLVSSLKVAAYPAESKEAKLEENALSTRLSADFEVKHRGIGVTATNQGNSYFYITPKSTSKMKAEDAVNILLANGMKARLIPGADGVPAMVEVQNLNTRLSSNFRTLSAQEISVANELRTWPKSGDYYSTPFTTPMGSIPFIIKKSNDRYYLHVGGLGESYPQTYDDPVDAMMEARLLAAGNGKRAGIFAQMSGDDMGAMMSLAMTDYATGE